MHSAKLTVANLRQRLVKQELEAALQKYLEVSDEQKGRAIAALTF